MPESTRVFEEHLARWVQMQKRVLDSIDKVESQLKSGDRLDLILATRVAFQHIIRTVQAFDKWLQDPFIIGHMPREMIEEVQRRTWKILKELLELDISHTSQFAELIDKLARQGKLNPLLYTREKGEQESPRLSI